MKAIKKTHFEHYSQPVIPLHQSHLNQLYLASERQV